MSGATTGVFARLRQRKLVQWSLAYIAAAFALIQVLDVVAQRFGWPELLERLLILAFAVGFFVTLVLAWYHGEKGAQRVTSTELMILALLLALGGGVLWRFARTPEAAPVAVQVSAAPTAGGTAIEDKSIAVLPFVNMSGDPQQDYFSDGMSEELLNALAQVNDLKVAGRTSSFYFKGKNEDLRTIGKTLGVANILEGSVRKQGEKVRITAQLIRVADNTHLWSHAYDGDLSDVFKLQEDIARAITDQLKVTLVGEQKTQLVAVATTNPDAYTLYLKATDALNKRDYQRMGEAIGWLQQAIELDPKFARAHARLAMIHTLGQARFGASKSEAERQAQLALELDPSDAEACLALGLLANQQRRFLDGRVAIDRALALAPNDAAVRLYAAEISIIGGYTRQGIAYLDRALAIDPKLPNALQWRGRQYLYAGDLDSAERMIKQSRELGLTFADYSLADVAIERGDYALARTLLLPRLIWNAGSMDCPKDPAVNVPIYLDGTLGGDAAARAGAVAVLDACLAAQPAILAALVPNGLMHLNLPARALAAAALGPTSDDASLFMNFWGPRGHDARRLPEFPAFARKVGFAALWDKYGPPDVCSKSIAGDYVCK